MEHLPPRPSGSGPSSTLCLREQLKDTRPLSHGSTKETAAPNGGHVAPRAQSVPLPRVLYAGPLPPRPGRLWQSAAWSTRSSRPLGSVVSGHRGAPRAPSPPLSFPPSGRPTETTLPCQLPKKGKHCPKKAEFTLLGALTTVPGAWEGGRTHGRKWVLPWPLGPTSWLDSSVAHVTCGLARPEQLRRPWTSSLCPCEQGWGDPASPSPAPRDLSGRRGLQQPRGTKAAPRDGLGPHPSSTPLRPHTLLRASPPQYHLWGSVPTGDRGPLQKRRGRLASTAGRRRRAHASCPSALFSKGCLPPGHTWARGSTHLHSYAVASG